MNILSIFYKNKKGGFNKRLYQLYEAIASEGHSVFFIGSQKISIKGEKVFQKIIHAPFRDKENIVFWIFFILLSLIRAVIVARKNHIDRIITFGPFYTVLCFLPIIFLKIPAITMVRADNMKHSRSFLRNLFFYIVDWVGIRLSKKNIFVSTTLKEVYKIRYRLEDDKIYVIPNNIERPHQISSIEKERLRLKFGISPRAFLISTSGVFNRGKNFDFLIKSLADLSSRDVTLIIIGDEVVPNGERRRLEKISIDEGLKQNVIFTGWQDDPRPLISSSDLYVFPSKFEGSPNALLEALGGGVPCLASNISELEEVLVHRELLFDLKSNQELTFKIAQAMKKGIFYNKIKLLSQRRQKLFLFDWNTKILNLSLL